MTALLTYVVIHVNSLLLLQITRIDPFHKCLVIRNNYSFVSIKISLTNLTSFGRLSNHLIMGLYWQTSQDAYL